MVSAVRIRPSSIHPSGVSRTPMAFVKAIATALERGNVALQPLLEQAHIAPESLQHAGARITAWQMERLSGLAMQALDDEALGWFSRRLPWGSYGMLARASLTAPTLDVALRRWCRHHLLLTPDIRVELVRGDGAARLEITESVNLGALREFCLVSMLRNALGLACWLVDSRIPLLGAQFPFAAPPHSDAYPVLFSGAVRFDATRAGLQLDATYLDLPVRRDEAALQQMLQRGLALTVLPYRRDRLLAQRVRQALAADPLAMRSADRLADMLNVSTRTLHRQLRDEGASLQQLKDDLRQRLAIDLLTRTRRPVAQVAALAGFRNEKSFARAFRQWTGQPPGAFRRGQPPPP